MLLQVKTFNKINKQLKNGEHLLFLPSIKT